MLHKIVSCSLLFIIAVGFCQVQNNGFSSQDGFFFPGEADRPDKFPLDPQRPTNPPLRPGSGTRTTNTLPTIPASTPASVQPPVFTPNTAEYNQCMDNCPATSEYNPVCGTNNVVYSNPGRLGCARFCGSTVQEKNFGQCSDGPARG